MKKRILWITLDLIFLIVFNLIFFLFGEAPHSTSVWVSYGFVHFAYLALVLTSLLIRQGTSAAVFGMSLYGVSSTYFIIEFIVALVFFLIKPEEPAVTIIVQAILAALFVVSVLSNMIANEHTADSEEQRERDLRYVKNAVFRIKPLINKAPDSNSRKLVEKAFDIISTSPVKSNARATQYEATALDQIEVLESAINRGDVLCTIEEAKRLITVAEERNEALRLSN